MDFEEQAPHGWRSFLVKAKRHGIKLIVGVFVLLGLFWGLRRLIFGVDDWQYRTTSYGAGRVGNDPWVLLAWAVVILTVFLLSYWLVRSINDIKRGKPRVIEGQIKYDGRRKLGWLNLSFPLGLVFIFAAGVGAVELADDRAAGVVGILMAMLAFSFFVYYLVASIVTMTTKLDKPGKGVFPLIVTVFVTILFVPSLIGVQFLSGGVSPFGVATSGAGVRSPIIGIGIGGTAARPAVGGSTGFSVPSGAGFQSSSPARELGATVGGSQTVKTFREQIMAGYMPYAGSITTEGLYSEYEFDMNFDNTCDQDFCAVYDTARASELGAGEFFSDYIAIGLDSGLDTNDLERNTQELVVVLDISSSMNSGMDSSNNFYGDKGRYQSKIGVAAETLRDMIDQMDSQDQLGIVLYDGQSYIAKPMRKISRTRTNAIKDHLRDLDPTNDQRANLAAAVSAAHAMLIENDNSDPDADKRIIVISGTPEGTVWGYYHTSQNPTKQQLNGFADNGVYTSFIGVGNAGTKTFADLANVTGANYTVVSSAKDFNQTLAEGFEAFITPLAFDLVVALDFPENSKFNGIDRLYGTSKYSWANGEIIRVGALFPSLQTDDGVKGGVVLAKLQRWAESTGRIEPNVTVRYSYIDRNGERQGGTKIITIGDRSGEYFDSPGIRKAIALGLYGDSMEQFLAQHQRYLSTPGSNQPLKLANDRYATLYGYMSSYFADEIAETGAFDMAEDMNILEKLSQAPIASVSPQSLVIDNISPNIPQSQPPIASSSLSTTPTTDTTPRIAMWWSKINQHVNVSTGQWETDPDGVSGAREDPLTYCRKWYPGTVRIQNNYSNETIRTFRAAGNTGEYGKTVSTIACLPN